MDSNEKNEYVTAVLDAIKSKDTNIKKISYAQALEVLEHAIDVIKRRPVFQSYSSETSKSNNLQ